MKKSQRRRIVKWITHGRKSHRPRFNKLRLFVRSLEEDEKFRRHRETTFPSPFPRSAKNSCPEVTTLFSSESLVVCKNNRSVRRERNVWDHRRSQDTERMQVESWLTHGVYTIWDAAEERLKPVCVEDSVLFLFGFLSSMSIFFSSFSPKLCPTNGGVGSESPPTDESADDSEKGESKSVVTSLKTPPHQRTYEGT